MVGERGVTLSGGQRQRVALARALAGEPDLLVLDDALSAVDADVERTVLDRMRARQVTRPTTAIIVSHRLSVIADCHEILVLDQGRVVERGRHQELISLGGSYARTWREQELERELRETD